MSDDAVDHPSSGVPVSADHPDSTAHVVGADHVTLVGSSVEETIAFYRDTLGLRLVLSQPNLDRPDVTHLFFDAGDGRLVTFFVTEDRDDHDGPQRPGVGAVHHLAFRIEPDELETVRESLDAAGHQVSEYDRGAFHSLYTRDHNGLTIELVAEKFGIPDDRRADVLARAQQARLEAGDAYVAGEHVAAALEALDLPVERYDLPEAPTGTGDVDD